MKMQPTPLFKMQTKHGPDSSPKCLFKTLRAAACSFHKMKSFESSCICTERWDHLLPDLLLHINLASCHNANCTFSWEGYGNFVNIQHAWQWHGVAVSHLRTYVGLRTKSFKTETLVFYSIMVSSWVLKCCPSSVALQAGTAFAVYKSIFKLCVWEVLSVFKVSSKKKWNANSDPLRILLDAVADHAAIFTMQTYAYSMKICKWEEL